MIRNIYPGYGITVTGNSSSDPYINAGAAGAGMLRWNPNMNCIEVNDGAIWKQIYVSQPIVELAPEAKEVVEWAKWKRQEEEKIKRLAKEYPAVRDLKEKLDILVTLISSEYVKE